jgi:hypothetical protein
LLPTFGSGAYGGVYIFFRWLPIAIEEAPKKYHQIKTIACASPKKGLKFIRIFLQKINPFFDKNLCKSA